MRTVVISTAVAVASIASASALVDFGSAFGSTSQFVSKEDATLHAHRAFDKIDVDRSGSIDIDEFAAQAIVYAEMARNQRTVTIDGNMVHRIDLPDGISDRLSPQERTSIDAQARRTFYEISHQGQPLSKAAWQMSQQRQFEQADRNANGRLEGRELNAFARNVSHARSA
ncbi:hypothetical protein [Parvularcula sp. LCG005]|uniref:hypothetical protein n=1 Tax=Parvularcula sp. LCG005 TaxID=3078805 RepID=UPI002942D664|nr:hypothetical protein [Parvularcula sp. LCG005]WOI52907.1 hypothetical protein RUI03_12190 [Parvularcula sp. LCG005]